MRRSNDGLLPLTTTTAAVLMAATACLSTAGIAKAAAQQIAIPAYFYPSFPDPLWTQMEDSVPVVDFAVMNPANGAGAAPDTNYVQQVAATRAAGVKVLGYVYSSYATRDAALLETDIDHYYDWYGVDGIFIDEAANDCASEPYYAALDAYVKTKDAAARTVINPGTTTPECFAASADVILNFEGSYAQYQSWTPLGWEAGYDASRFWHLVYSTSESEVPAAVLLSQQRNAGFVYVTPDGLANPWDSLPGPSYWQTELAWVQPDGGSCLLPVAKPKLELRGIDTPAADDRLKLSGRFTLAGAVAVDPVAKGFRFTISDSGGVEADVTLPAGAYAGTSGWLGSGGKWTWRDDGDTPLSGIARATLKTKADGATTVVSFKVGASDGSFPVDAAELPLSATLLLEPEDPTSNCATATFPGPKPACELRQEGASIRCK